MPLIDLITLEPEKVRQQLKQRLVGTRYGEILFPSSLAEFEGMAMKVASGRNLRRGELVVERAPALNAEDPE